MLKMGLVSIILIFTLLLSGCGQDLEDKIDDAILSAKISLSTRDCDKAIRTLEAIGLQETNAKYLQTLASGYACKANFSEPNFFGNDLPLLGGSSSTFGNFTMFSTSGQMDSYNASSFENLQRAIDILLYAGGLSTARDPSVAARAAVMEEYAGDINTQLMYMLLAQLGQYLRYYGNGDATGAKGQEDNTKNQCLYNYTEGPILAYLATGKTGSCTAVTLAANGGHADFDEAATKIRRMCQGVVILNNLFDVLPGVLAQVTSGDDFDDLDVLTGLQDAATAAGMPANDILTVKSLTKCIADNTADTYLQYYFTFFFETLYL